MRQLAIDIDTRPKPPDELKNNRAMVPTSLDTLTTKFAARQATIFSVSFHILTALIPAVKLYLYQHQVAFASSMPLERAHVRRRRGPRGGGGGYDD